MNCHRITRRHATLALIASAMLVTATGPASAAAGPTQAADPAVAQIQSFYDALLDTMKHAKALGVAGRYEKLKPAIEKSFALADMMHAAVGPGWAKLSDSDRDKLVTAFERKTVAEYASNFDDFNGEQFLVEPASKPRGADKIVQSKLIAGGQTIPFGYRMRLSGGSWKVLDIYLNGVISQLATQRSDFAATLAKDGAPALEKKLNDKADKLLKSK